MQITCFHTHETDIRHYYLYVILQDTEVYQLKHLFYLVEKCFIFKML